MSSIRTMIMSLVKAREVRYYRTLQQVAGQSDEAVRALQLAKLRALVAHFAEMPYYRAHLAEAGVASTDLRDLADLAQLPPVTKEFLRAHLDAIGASPLAVQQISTSGSSGVNTVFWGDQRARIARHAATRFGFSLAGVDAWRDATISIWGLSPSTSRKQRLLEGAVRFVTNTRLLNGYGLDEARALDYLRQLAAARPRILVGYPCYLTLLAQAGLRHGVAPQTPAAVITSGEQLLETQREVIERYFQTRLFNRYGSREFSQIAHEDATHGALYIPPTRFLVETDAHGELLITDLDNYATPFIRYRIGDCGAVGDARTHLGRPGQCIIELAGRVHDLLTTPSGRLIPGQFWTLLSRSVPGIQAFQIVQLDDRRIEMRIIPDATYDAAQEPHLHAHLHEEFGDEVALTVQLCTALEETAMGKRKFIMRRTP
ncbi:MAG TPA: hypothetical protein PLZ36_03185 [Armatimonadota bacterium]|nr:hypothetical protein [Armatimonadota bacterium]HOS42562.1 hypothetical protein [Armatimonadota bacterium]